MEEVIAKLADYIATEVLRQKKLIICSSKALISTGSFDTFSLVNLSYFIEDNFGVRVAGTELNAGTFDTLQQLARLILGHQ